MRVRFGIVRGTTDTMAYIEKDMPDFFNPNVKDLIEISDFISEKVLLSSGMTDVDIHSYSYHVWYRNWCMKDGIIVLELTLLGE